ncbi:TSUP family transporter [Pseudactinotalea sp. Z1739]|uniref:TSUP family transporter n=1 Tax=Pseudactinotalea sp. Z1739 TaxID=3413028 RepID=UPI003C7DD1A5
MLYVLVILAVFIGALAQRATGLGFAMISAPVLVLLLGAFDGVLLVNLCGAVAALLIITRVWHLIDWRQFRLLTVPALLAVVPGTIISVLFTGPGLQIIVGVILIVALTASLIVRRSFRPVAITPSALLSGAVSGFTNTTAGVGGPALSVHAVLTRWDHRAFAATIQPYFVVSGMVAFIAKVAAAPEGLPAYAWWLWLMIVGAILTGLAAGEWVSTRISARAARIAVILLAYGGGVVAVIDGVLAAG